MSYSFNKKRQVYEVREVEDGKRKYVGSYKEEREAMEISLRYQIAEDIKQHTLDNYELELETHDDSMIRLLKPFKDWMKKRKIDKKRVKLGLDK